MAILYADRMQLVKSSEIREILKITQNPEIISFAGGLPAPELFPVEDIQVVTQAVLEEDGTKVLQYATTEGHVPLREKIAQRMNYKFKTNVAFQDIIITSGSQQGLDFAGKIFLNEGDIVLCENPSYLGAINAFRSYKANFIEIATDDCGMVIEDLADKLKNTPNVKLIYCIPDFQNPTGKTWSVERRKQFIELVNQYDVPVIEDNPYGELRYDGEIPPGIKAFDTKGLVVFLGTYSKTFCPGLRVGWVCASPEILSKFIQVKQSSDLHTSIFSQRIIDKYIEMYDFDAHVQKIVSVYRQRRDLCVSTMKETFPASVKFTHPQGGLFTWVELPKQVNARDVLVECLKNKVAYVPGGAFFPNGGNENTLRINYSNMPDERIVDGLTRIGKVLKQYV